MQQNSQHTYSNMNQDLSKSKYPPDIYYDAENIYLVSENKQATGSVSNIKGTTLLYTIPDVSSSSSPNTFVYFVDGSLKTYDTNQNLPATYFPLTGMKIIGMEPLLNDFIIWTGNSDSTSPLSMCCVWKMTLKPTPTLTLMYMNLLNLSTKYPIEAECRYETETIQKAYWTDRYNELRFLNLADPDLRNTPLDFVNVVPTYGVGSITLDSVISGGNFTSGMVGWAYSLSNFNGQETKISPVSKLVNANQSNDGNLVNEVTGRSFRIKIETVDTRFDVINIFRLFYTSLDAEPQITLAAQEFADSSTVYWTDDYNTFIRTLSTAEFTGYGTEPFISGTIATKNEYLFSDDNTYRFFDFDFDARAYRFAFIFDSQQPQSSVLYKADGTVEAIINGANPVWPTDQKLDAINKSNAANTRKNMNQANGFYTGAQDPDYDRFVRQSNGVLLGGTGPNIEYRFIEHTTIVNTAAATSPIVSFDTNNSLLNPNNQILTGFKRDEIYRMGIVFFNNRGQQSFVKWIGDIRIPPATRLPYCVENQGVDEMQQVQIEFTLLNPPTSRNDIVGYQYVRVERTKFDSTIIAQGVVNPFARDNNTPNVQYYGGKNQPICAIDGYHNWYTNDDNGQHTGGSSDTPSSVYGPIAGETIRGMSSVMSARAQPPSGPSGKILYQATASLASGPQFPGGIPDEFRNIAHNSNYQYQAAQFISNEVDEFTPSGGFFNVIGLSKLKRPRTIRYPNGELENPAAYNYASVGGSYEDGSKLSATYETFVRAGALPVDANNEQDIDIIRLEPEDILYVPERDGFSDKSMKFSSGTPFNFIASGGFESNGDLNLDPQTKGDVQVQMNKYLAFLITDTPNKGLDTALWSGTDGLRVPTSTTYFMVADYKRELSNQYGGSTYAARTRNVYMPSSPFIPLGTSVANSFGDTWVSYQIFQYTELWNRSNLTLISSSRFTFQIPMENRVRYDLTKNDFMRYGVPQALFEETFQYNTVYSQDYDLSPLAIRPINWLENARFIAETAYSDPKLNGEQTDSWTVWRVGNRKPLDAKWGRCVGLLENGDTLFFFQENAIGYWDVQPYKQTTTTDGGTIILGTGTVLESREYLSTNEGCQHKFSICKTPFGIVWYDQNNKAMRILQKGAQELSVAKGISTTLYNLPLYEDMPTNGNGITASYDHDRLQMIMTFLKTDTESNYFSIAYNFLTEGFVCKLKELYPRLIQSGTADTFMASPDGRSLHTFGNGDYGNFFGTIHESSITIVVNSVSSSGQLTTKNVAQNITKLLTNLQWNSEAYDTTGAQLHDKTVSHVEIWNDYQSTGKVDVTTMDFNQFKRLMRTWLFKVPFDQSDEMNRMRSQYFFVKLYIPNADNYQYILHDLTATVILQPL